jgi:hypothetical protein
VLECGDVSHWPLGIFRRSFVRSYAKAIGVPAEPIVAEFVRLFPEPGEVPQPLPQPVAAAADPAPPAPPPPAPAEMTPAEGSLRLTLAGDSQSERVLVLRDRATAAAIDGLSILALALMLWIVRASSLGVSLGVTAFGFVIARGLSSGRSGVTQWMRPALKDVPAERPAQNAATIVVHQPRGARRGPNRSGGARHGHGSSRRERVRRAGM